VLTLSNKEAFTFHFLKLYVKMLSRVVYRCVSSSNRRNINAINYSDFKSPISLEKLYPNSSLDMTKPQPIPEAGPDKFSGFIPMDKVQITSSKSSGPGGQSVNTTNSKVDIRFKVAEASWIPEKIRSTMLTKLRTHISREGFFIIQSDRTRSLHLNTADALEKLREYIRSCEPVVVAQPSQETMEKLRKQQEKATRERLQTKVDRKMVKSNRGAASADM